MTWKTKPLRDLADLCLGKMLDKDKNKGELRPYLANVNVRWGRFDLSDLREMRFEDRELERYGLRTGDIVMCEGGEPGRCAIWRDQLRGMMIQKALHRIRAKSEIDHRFLFYSLMYKGKTHVLDQYFTGATIKHLPGEKIALVEIEYPSLEIQRRIASILSAYDDLIDNNTRRIAILEEMARRLYEEWFVRLRFPGHEGVRLVESELGLVPEGWQCCVFTDIADVLSGGTPKKSELNFWDGKIPFFTPTDAPKTAYVLTTDAHITDTGLAHCASKLYPKDTVFITARGTVGKLALASQDMAMNQSCYALRARSGYGQIFLYLATQGIVKELKSKSHGAVFDTIIMDTFRLMRIIRPPMNLAERLENIVRPLFDLSLTLSRKNTNLRTTRDLLLPKLISGELDVSKLPEPEEVAA